MAEKKPLVPIVKVATLQMADKSSTALQYKNLETYSILWLDPSIGDLKDFADVQQKLRTSVNYIKVFKTTDECEQYFRFVPEQDRIIFIVNNQLGQTFIPLIHNLRQIFSIYIYCSDQKRGGQWAKEFPKIKIVSTQLDVIIAQIKSDRARRSHNKIDEPLSMNIFKRDLDYKANDAFIRTHLLMDCLVGLKDISSEVKKLVELCEDQYKDNKNELGFLREFQDTYAGSRAIRWYTKQSFLFRIFNKALRLQNIDVLFLFRFFIHDLQEQLIKNHCKQPMRLYRTQLITNEQHELLINATGGFLMVNTFLSTTVDKQIALSYLDNLDKSDEFNMKRVLFEIDADPRIEGIKPFANIIWLSYCFGQQEVLMMMGSIFRLVEIHNDEQQHLTVVRMVLCSENDDDLKEAIENLRNLYRIRDVNLLSFGQILSEMSSFEDAKQFYLHLLNDLPTDHQDLANCYHALGNAAADKGDYDLSLEWYQKLHELFDGRLKPDDPRLADSHFIIGNIYLKKNDTKHALESLTKAMTIYKQCLDENHLTIAECSDRIATAFEKEKKYFQALNHYEKSLSIRQKRLPADHLDLATNHSKLAAVRFSLCHYFLALGHYNISLKIKINALPAEHLDIAADYRGMGNVYKAKGELHQALNYYQKTMEIYRQLLPSDHPDVVEIERTIRFLVPQTKI